MPHNLRHSTTRELSPGHFYPCGATLTGDGVNFAIFSEHAAEVWLLLFDDPDGDPTDVIRIENRTRHIWHVFVHGVRPGQFYGYRMKGSYDPARGLRFNEHKLLIDPYARALSGKLRYDSFLHFGYDMSAGKGDMVADLRESTGVIPKGIVVDGAFDWQGDAPPQIEFEKLVIYETHVKGFTAHRSSGVDFPGTYLGFVGKIPYLKELGINAVEFLPIQEIYVEDFLLTNGLTNYWGYNTIGFFAPESSYGTGRFPGCQVEEFKTMVRELHKAGIEVILDVVYNHTGEGNENGPTLSFKGIDNPNYYHLCGPPEEPYRYYMNYSGCGNSLRTSSKNVLRLVMDSLRYWVEEMHVDGFRFDLASILGRGEGGDFRRSSSFFDAVAQDPVLNRVKLIAEPWDLDTYQVGNFPVDWCEWNGRFRDTVRRFLKGEPGQAGDLGWRLTGSADLYGEDGRSAYNSVNYITCHDGFTLNDLVSYNTKHNEANLEKNFDGSPFNHSWNCGIEGETADPVVTALRRRQAKNFLCLLFFSTGTPMLLGGDEFLRTQCGNNNAFCQDNDISWFDWRLAEANADILDFCRRLIRFKKSCRILQRKKFFHGCRISEEENLCDIVWYDRELNEPAWHDPELHTLCFQLYGNVESGLDREYLLYFILNADNFYQPVLLPGPPPGKSWSRLVDTALGPGDDFLEPGNEAPLTRGDLYLAYPRSVVILTGT